MKIKFPDISLRMKVWGYRLAIIFAVVCILAMCDVLVTVWRHPDKIDMVMYQIAASYMVVLGVVSWIKDLFGYITKIDEIKIRINAWKRP